MAKDVEEFVRRCVSGRPPEVIALAAPPVYKRSLPGSSVAQHHHCEHDHQAAADPEGHDTIIVLWTSSPR
jgi:hypothetical protein